VLSESAAAARLARGERAQWRLKMDAASAEAGPLMIAEAAAPHRNAPEQIYEKWIPVFGKRSGSNKNLEPEADSAGENRILWSEITRRPADPARWGDAVLVRKDTPTSYHLSVVVDDAAQGVSHVTRGMDLLAAADLHVLLQRLLGLPAPLYCHHRLLLDGEGQKLAKSRKSASLKSLRDAGWTAADIRCELGFA
jgi:glutamyl-Q tRNA(Asp) synthetase